MFGTVDATEEKGTTGRKGEITISISDQSRLKIDRIRKRASCMPPNYDDYKIIKRKYGTGGSGHVHKAHAPDGKIVALKVPEGRAKIMGCALGWHG